MQALSCFVKTISEPECLTLSHVVQLGDILSNVESYFTQIHCQEAHDKIGWLLAAQLVCLLFQVWKALC